MKAQKDLHVRIYMCRDCKLPQGYSPQLRPPGPAYKPGGVVFIQINPGHIGSLSTEEIEHKYIRQNSRTIATLKTNDTKKLLSLQKQFAENPIDANYEDMYNAFLKSMSEIWGWPPGKYGSTITAHGVSLDEVAVLNLAQCPVPNDSYKNTQLELCWENWTKQMLTLLKPSIIVAQGKQVFEFIRKRPLPCKATLIEGLHHADRRSKKVKEEILSTVREAMR